MMSLTVNIEKTFEIFMGCSLMTLTLFDRKSVRVEMRGGGFQIFIKISVRVWWYENYQISILGRQKLFLMVELLVKYLIGTNYKQKLVFKTFLIYMLAHLALTMRVDNKAVLSAQLTCKMFCLLRVIPLFVMLHREQFTYISLQLPSSHKMAHKIWFGAHYWHSSWGYWAKIVIIIKKNVKNQSKRELPNYLRSLST